MKNIGDTPGKLLVHAAPLGFGKFFTRAATEFTKPGVPDMDRLGQIAAENGIHFFQT